MLQRQGRRGFLTCPALELLSAAYEDPSRALALTFDGCGAPAISPGAGRIWIWLRRLGQGDIRWWGGRRRGGGIQWRGTAGRPRPDALNFARLGSFVTGQAARHGVGTVAPTPRRRHVRERGIAQADGDLKLGPSAQIERAEAVRIDRCQVLAREIPVIVEIGEMADEQAQVIGQDEAIVGLLIDG